MSDRGYATAYSSHPAPHGTLQRAAAVELVLEHAKVWHRHEVHLVEAVARRHYVDDSRISVDEQCEQRHNPAGSLATVRIGPLFGCENTYFLRCSSNVFMTGLPARCRYSSAHELSYVWFAYMQTRPQGPLILNAARRPHFIETSNKLSVE